MLWYASKFKDIVKWCYITAAVHFVVFLFFFLCISYLSTGLSLKYNPDGTATFVSQFEKYVVLAASLYMIVPFAFSTVLFYGLFHKNQTVFRVFNIGSLFSSVVILIVVVGCGVFLAVKSSPDVAYAMIGVGLALIVLLQHGVFIVLGVKDKYANKSGNEADESNEVELRRH